MLLHRDTLHLLRELEPPISHDVLDTKGAALFLGVSESWLNKLRVLNPAQSPRFIKAGRRVLYRLSDLRDWQDQRMHGGGGED